MALYIKTTFDKELKRLNTRLAHFSKKNKDSISTKDFPEFKDMETTGIFDIKIHPNEIKAWFLSLPKEVQSKNYFIVWENGWISIPGKIVEQISFDL